MLLKSLVFAVVVAAKVQFMGINIAGFEFGCEIDGTCPTGSAIPPLSDGPGQMQHFVKDDQMNIFRMPVSWQFLLNNKLGGTLDSSNMGKYDKLIKACLSTGAYCAIDLHNFARWNGKIIGQDGGPSNDQFADIWKQLATKYKDNEKVIFGLMNEPHDVDITAWASSCQAAVTAIRNMGATTQMILLPGNNFSSAGTFVSNGSGAALIGVKNPDGTTAGLILDIHKYLDVDNSGNHNECTTDNTKAFAEVAQFLRENGRKGLVSETGAGSTASCFTAFCAQNSFINQNSDVYLGIIAWAAGSFSTGYTLSLTPSKQNGKFVDNKLASQCVVSVWQNAATAGVTSAIVSKTTSAEVQTPSSSTAVKSETAVQSLPSPTTTLRSVAGGAASVEAPSKSTKSAVENTDISGSRGSASASATLAVITTPVSGGSRNSSSAGNAASTGISTSTGATPTFQISGATVVAGLGRSFVVGICAVVAFPFL